MVTIEQLKSFVESNPKLVTRRESVTYPGLFVLKYIRKVFYDNLWDADGILNECRGLVVDKDYNPLIVPFTKIYNRGENGTDIPLTEEVTAVVKVNGFMAAATHIEGRGVVVSTTGSLDSPFVELAKKWLEPSIIPWIEMNGSGTYIFEICDPTDPHIISEIPGPVLIGRSKLHIAKDDVFHRMAHTEDYLDQLALRMGVRRPTHAEVPFGTVVNLLKIVKHEGFVVYGDNITLKLKSPYYLIKKLFARKRNEYLSVDWLIGCKHTIDEEYYPLVDKIIEDKEFFMMLDEQQKLKYIEDFLRK
jgi:hypothetical protein